jgi:ribosomal protein L24
MEEGDEVSIGSGMFEGKNGRVTEIDWENGSATVEVAGFGEQRTTQVPVRDLESLGGSDEELVEKVASSVRQSVWQVFETRQQLWWARRADDDQAPSVELLEEFHTFRQSLLDEYDEAVDRTLGTVRETLEQQDGPDPSEWLSNHASRLQREWRQKADANKQTFFEEVTPADELASIDEEVTSQADNSSFLDEEAVRQQIVQRRMSDMIDRGLQLWEACEAMADDE